MTSYALFETALGPMGIAWGPGGVVAVQLPESSREETRARLLRGVPGALESRPPAPVQAAVDGITALLAGEEADLSGVPVDLTGVPRFHREVYDVARTIAPGATLTYGEVATRLGDPGAARAVGQALGANPVPVIVPCHRVVAADGRSGGFSARGGAATKIRLLRIEGATAACAAPTLFD